MINSKQIVEIQEYHKIQSLYKRDQKTKKFTAQYSLPEFELLKDIEWEFSEKIDGTNIRIFWDCVTVEVKGRTDNANLSGFVK